MEDMNDVCASIGLSNLKEVDENVISKHKKNALYYNKELKNVEGITLLENKPDHESSYWIYTIKVDNRDNFMRMMEKNKIAVSRVHERNDKHTCMHDYISSLPTLDKVVEQMICIPVVNCIKKGW